jgi:hypothetical protein
MFEWLRGHHHFRPHHHDHRPFPTHFIIYQEGVITMGTTPTPPALTPLLPGNSPVFAAVLQPAGSSLGNVVPQWTSSDPHVTVTADPTGLIATAAIAADCPQGTQVTLTIKAGNPDNVDIAEGAIQFEVGTAPPPPPPAPFPTSFSISQIK